MRFSGNIEAKVDKKNRVFVPAQFRRILFSSAANGQEQSESVTLYIRKDVYQNCLVLYPENVWEEELSSLRERLNKWVPEQQNVYRQFLLDTEAVETDANGRILLPRRLMDMVGISDEVCFLGVDNTMEIWPRKALDQPLVEEQAFRRVLQDIMK